MENLIDFFLNNFENCVWLAIMIISLCPSLESKIAIPFAMNTDIWGDKAFSPIMALILSFIGSLLPCFLIMILARKLKKKTSGFVCSKFLNRYFSKSSQIDQKANNFVKYLSLTGFVAIPLPLTGVWASSLIAGFTNLEFKYSFLSIAIGNFISASAITLLCTLFTNSISYILIISLIIIIIFFLFDLFISMFKNFKKATV